MRILYTLILIVNLFMWHRVAAQCTNTVIDWDYREFFARNNSTIRSYVSLARAQNQAFAFGANKVTITHNYTADASIGGENTTHTGSASSYGSGADVEFTGNGIITFTFQNSVTNLRFSFYDIDRSQRIDFAALNGATPINVALSKVGGTVISFTNNNTTTARADATNTTVANTSTDGTVNVDIAGPVTQVTMTITNTGTCSSFCGTGGNESGVFWFSDITACATGSFPSNYYAVSRPFTGMPPYVLAVRNDSVYYINPGNGVCKYLFADIGPGNLNSMSYDPYNRYLYYTYSLTGPGGDVNANEKALRRYDYNMDTFGVVVGDVTTLGIPTFEQGVESGAAGFYGGNLYLGIEGGSSSTESMIYRLELNASNFPVAFSQVYAQASETSGGTRLHDWSDFGLYNGILYDWDAGATGSGTNKNYYHQNLITGAVTEYTPVGALIPRQTAIDWTGQLYNVGSAASTAKGTIAPYNGTDNIDYAQEDTITYRGVKIVGSWGDAAEAFRPFCDFGDAPATYDPDPWSPAVNEREANLRIGASFDLEWNKTSSALANADGADEDGIATVTLFATFWNTYHVQVSVYNNTDSNATLMGWLDYNGNGTFDAGEASAAATVAPSASMQNIALNWTGISSSLPAGTYIYLRVRLTSSFHGMTAAHATGWFDNGETEDYRVPVETTPLPFNLIVFDAKVVENSKVKLNWTSGGEELNFQGYEIQRSINGSDWEYVKFVKAKQGSGVKHDYVTTDNTPHKGASRYRLKLKEGNDSARYSEVRAVKISGTASLITLFPNPAFNQSTISINSAATGTVAHVYVSDEKGNRVFYAKTLLGTENNTVELPVQSWASGTYIVSVTTNDGFDSKRLVLRR